MGITQPASERAFSPLRTLAFPFWNRREQRVRWGYRSIVPMLLSVVFLIGASIAGSSLGHLIAPLLPAQYAGFGGWLLGNLLKVVLALLLMLFWARVVDRRPIREYGLFMDGAWWRDFVAGMIIAAGIVTVAIFIMQAVGWTTIAVVGSLSPTFVLVIVLGFVSALGIGLWEEILYRGIALKNAAEGLHGMRVPDRLAVVLALLIVSLGFTLYHVLLGFNFAAFGYYFISSLLIGIGVILTKRIGIAIGLHAMYDFFHGIVFVVSPEPSFPAIFGLTLTKPVPQLWLGPPSLLESCIIACALVITVLWVRSQTGRLEVQRAIAHWIPRPK